MTERLYRVPGDEGAIGHGETAYSVQDHRVKLPDAPWVNELVQRGVVEPDPEQSAGAEIPTALIEAGFATAKSIQAASDDELLAVPGVGKATLRQIREEIG